MKRSGLRRGDQERVEAPRRQDALTLGGDPQELDSVVPPPSSSSASSAAIVAPSKAADDPGRRLLEVAGAIVAIAAVLLPVTGFAARTAAFAAGLPLDQNSRWSFAIAWSAPIPELAVWGFAASVIALAILIVFYLTTWLLTHPVVRAQPDPPRWQTRTTRGVATVLLGLFLAFVPSFPAFWIAIPFAFAVSVATRKTINEGRRPHFFEFWWVLAAFLIVGGILLGLTGVVPEQAVAQYRFRDEVHAFVADGRYDQLGDANGFMFLSPCGSGGGVVVVKEEEVLAIAPLNSKEHSFGPSLFDIVVHHRAVSLGYEPC